MPETQTYFVIDETRGVVKIGRSCRPYDRVEALQTGSATPLRIVLVLQGDRELELHERFVRQRQSGEWFRLDDELERFIHESGGGTWIPPFRAWLLQHRFLPAQTELARLAFLVAADHGFPKTFNDILSLRRYLTTCGRWKGKRRWMPIMECAFTAWRLVVAVRDKQARRVVPSGELRICVKCSGEYAWTAGQIDHGATRGWSEPKNCYECRRAASAIRDRPTTDRRNTDFSALLRP